MPILTTDKILIYQMMVRLFGNGNGACRKEGTLAENGCGKMNDISMVALRSIRQLGCNYVWYTGLLQQATQTDWSAYGVPRQNRHVVKGVAGSPYAITDYYTVSCELADNPAQRMEEFDALVERTHSVGLKVIIDFVPNHVARGYHSTSRPEGVRDLGADDDTGRAFDAQNNFYYLPGEAFAPQFSLGEGEERYEECPARVTGNDCFHAHPGVGDWYETVKLNYGVDYQGGGATHFDPIPSTWQKMLDILLHWAARGVDGFRCDMAGMVPVEFWQWAIARVKEAHPGVLFIAELYEPHRYHDYIHRGGFDYLYDKVGLYDTLRGVVEGKRPAYEITWAWQSIEGLQDRMLNFLENHDEQRIASDFFAGDPDKGRPALVVSALMNVNPFMLYFGQELGERGMDEEGFSGCDGRTTIFDYWSLGTMRSWMGPERKWRRNLLPGKMRRLREYYAQVMAIASRRVVARGMFYDVTYANLDNPMFDKWNCYAFLRALGSEVLLVVANFDSADKELEVIVPPEAWNYVGVTARCHRLTDLMTDNWDYGRLTLGQPVSVRVGGHDAVVLRLHRR